MEIPKENIIHETIESPENKREGFEISTEQARQITDELSRLDDAINHDQPIRVEDLENLNEVARGTKIDIGGEIMTVEEAENIPDLKMNIEIWNEMREGNFENTNKLTRIIPAISRYLEKVEGNIDLNSLTSAKGLILPTSIGWNLDLSSLTSAEGLTLPISIGGYLNLRGLTSAEGLILPTSINGGLYLNSLTSAEGLILSTSIGGYLDLRSLTSAEGLTLPTSITGSLYLDGLTSADKEELKKKYPRFADKIK